MRHGNARRGVSASSRRRGGPIKHRATTVAGGSNVTNVVIANPGVTGDFVYVLLWYISTLSESTMPAGWNLISSKLSGTIRYALWGKKLDGSEGSTLTITNNPSNPTAGGRIAVAGAYEGGVGAVDLVGSSNTVSTNTSNAPSINVTHPGILLAHFNRTSTVTITTPPAGMVERMNQAYATRAAVYELDPSLVGASGIKSVLWGGTTGTADCFQMQIY